MVASTMPQDRDQQGIQDSDHGGPDVRVARIVFDQALTDVVTGRLPKKIETVAFADGLEIDDRVAE